MNATTKFYGLIGLMSAVSKNSFYIGQKINEASKIVCHYAEQGFAKLKEAANYSAKLNEQAKEKCHEWEQWANEKHAEAKRQEEINEQWESINPYQPSKLEKLTKATDQFYRATSEAIAKKKQEIWLEKRYTLPRQEKACCPGYLQKVLSLY